MQQSPSTTRSDPRPLLTDILEAAEWRHRAMSHESRILDVLDGYFERRHRGASDPVLDFLFEYYAFRRARLLRWSPGLGVGLAGVDTRWQRRLKLDRAHDFVAVPDTAGESHGCSNDRGKIVALDPSRFPERRVSSLEWILDVLEKTQARTPFLGCCGMHEWAMVYRTDKPRHAHLPLRMDADALARFVETQPIQCSHYDAFRFFTPEARPLNRIQPTMERIPELEQPGCLHTNMDLYRWATKLYPWIGSDLIADAFELAVEIRRVDMRASPYDLRAHGYEPIPVETAEGRREYAALQADFARRAQPLRARLIDAVRCLVQAVCQ